MGIFFVIIVISCIACKILYRLIRYYNHFLDMGFYMWKRFKSGRDVLPRWNPTVEPLEQVRLWNAPMEKSHRFGL